MAASREHALFIDSFTGSFTASTRTGLMHGESHSFARGNNVVFGVTLSTSMSGSYASVAASVEARQSTT